jgi:hypothetical protein
MCPNVLRFFFLSSWANVYSVKEQYLLSLHADKRVKLMLIKMWSIEKPVD